MIKRVTYNSEVLQTPKPKSLKKDISDPALKGILPRCLKTMVTEFQKFDNGFLVENCELKASFMEIYNETITDLLDNN